MSQEYIGSIAILLVALLKIFKIEVAQGDIVNFVTAGLALWVAIRRYQKGDITIGGFRK